MNRKKEKVSKVGKIRKVYRRWRSFLLAIFYSQVCKEAIPKKTLDMTKLGLVRLWPEFIEVPSKFPLHVYIIQVRFEKNYDEFEVEYWETLIKIRVAIDRHGLEIYDLAIPIEVFQEFFSIW